ncbi:MAG: 4-alpha-glucanotransferase [Candidatus Dormibacteraceae bacterium]
MTEASPRGGPARRADAWGIEPGYQAIGGRWVPTESETAAAILRALGAGAEAPPPSPVLVAGRGDAHPLPGGPHEVDLEGGGTVPCEGAVPRNLATGYHTLRNLRDGAARRLIVTPAACHLPADLRGWALAAQLYAARSERSWGIGDLRDLRRLARWARSRGGTAILLNPLHAPGPGHPQEPSPYYPSSRVYRNPLYLAVEQVPGAERMGEDLERLARAGRALNGDRRLDRDRVFDLKEEALRALFQVRRPDAAFDAWRAERGTSLERFATYCALALVHGPRWSEWPPGLRHPDGAAVRAFAAESREEITFHAWLQWLLEQQLVEAARELPPITDLAVGGAPDGADAWAWQDVLCLGTSVGAPPDPFATSGQSWLVPPFDPWRLRAAAYQPFVELLRAAFRGAFGVRLDHVMGLFRLYWIPPGVDARAGAYVRYPAEDLLGILALESERARGVVVGEDLGTVDPAFRIALRRRRVLGYRLLLFEEEPPADYPEDAFCAATTHDLPTLTGLWRRPELAPEARRKVARATGLDGSAAPSEVVVAAARALAASPCRLASATLEDLALDPDQPNHPGTISPDNWSRALPRTLEELERDSHAEQVVAALHRPPGPRGVNVSEG